jgi:hypothetical protein
VTRRGHLFHYLAASVVAIYRGLTRATGARLKQRVLLISAQQEQSRYPYLRRRLGHDGQGHLRCRIAVGTWVWCDAYRVGAVARSPFHCVRRIDGDVETGGVTEGRDEDLRGMRQGRSGKGGGSAEWGEAGQGWARRCGWDRVGCGGAG